MEIKTVNRIYDDDGVECCEGDTVLLFTDDMDEETPAKIDTIMTNVVKFILDSATMGYLPMTVRKQNVKSIKLHKRKFEK